MQKLKLVNIWQSLLIAGLLCAVIFLLLEREFSRSEETTPTVEHIILPAETDADEMTTDDYVKTTGRKIYLSDPALGQIWLPVLEGVPECSHDAERLVTRNGLTYYLDQNRICSTLGVDVSSHQGEIDWETVKAAGIDFAILRCGFRGYGSGQLAVDERFDQNIQGALAAGIEVGVYFYSQAISVAEAIEEAEMTLALIGDSPVTYPVVYDWEIVPEDEARTDSMTVDLLNDCTKAYCDTIREAGLNPMVYQNKRTSLLKLDLQQLTDYDFWLAEYNDEATYFYDYRIWQYCSDGSIPGISGDVDLNVCFVPY